jgi:hypothetical protein
MSRPKFVALCILSALALVTARIGAADPAPTSAGDTTPQTPTQVTIPYDEGTFLTDDGQMGPTKEHLTIQRWYSLTLDYITSQQFQSEMDGAFLPNVRPVLLRPGESVHCPLRFDGVNTIITGLDDHTLICSATSIGFELVRELAKSLDSPVRRLPKSAKSGSKIPEKVPNAACQSAPDAPVPPGTGSVEEVHHWYRFPLSHTTPTAVLERLRHSYAPGDRVLVLKPGEEVSNSFPMAGVLAIFANLPDNSLVVLATTDGYVFVRGLVQIIDVAKTPVARPHPDDGKWITVGPGPG